MDTPTVQTANDRFKNGFGDWFWYSIAGAALFHLALFAVFPELSSADVSIENETLEAINIPDNIEIPPPPPSATAGDRDLSAAPTFTPMTVRPEILNRDHVQRVLVRNYPPLLRDAGIGGTPTVHFFIDTDGTVVRRLLAKSSGYPALDEAALAVAKEMKFSPALNREKKVQVWVEIPIVFTAK